MEKNGKPLNVSGEIWLKKVDRAFLAGDRITLLEKIRELGVHHQGGKIGGHQL